MKTVPVFSKSFFQLQDSCLAGCKFLLVKPQFCRTVLYVIIVILEIFAGHLPDRIRHFVSQNEMLLILTDRLALFYEDCCSDRELLDVHILMSSINHV